MYTGQMAHCQEDFPGEVFWFGVALLIVAIGFSRLYLGVHYFSDVVGGYAAGLLWLSACISGLEVARRWHAGARPAAATSTPR